MTIKKKFTTDELEALDLPYNLSDVREVEERRWYTIREGVFEREGAHWLIQFCDPSTEMQEGLDPWNDADEVEATKVEKRQVTVERWVPVS